MVTVNDILHCLEALAPKSMKMDWDNVGLLCGSGSTPVTRVLVALDPFEHVCQEAASWGAELIVTHHPLIFRPLSSVTDETGIGRSIMLLCRHGISAINAHTNLDCAPDGVNEVLAKRLGLISSATLQKHGEERPLPRNRDIRQADVINPMGVDESGQPYGLLRCGYVNETDLDSFLAFVKRHYTHPACAM